MPTIKCKTEGCPYDIVYLPDPTTVIFAASLIRGKSQIKPDVSKGTYTPLRENVMLTLQCIKGDINNYEVDL